MDGSPLGAEFRRAANDGGAIVMPGGTGWLVRDLRREDQDDVRALVLGGLAERWGDAFDPSCNPDLDDLWATYVETGAEVVVAEIAGALVATGMLLAQPDGSGRLVRTSVATSHRRLGLGRAIVDELVARAAQRSLAPVVVLTDTLWTSAVALYRSCGFRVVAVDEVDTHLVLDR